MPSLASLSLHPRSSTQASASPPETGSGRAREAAAAGLASASPAGSAGSSGGGGGIAADARSLLEHVQALLATPDALFEGGGQQWDFSLQEQEQLQQHSPRLMAALSTVLGGTSPEAQAQAQQRAARSASPSRPAVPPLHAPPPPAPSTLPSPHPPAGGQVRFGVGSDGGGAGPLSPTGTSVSRWGPPGPLGASARRPSVAGSQVSSAQSTLAGLNASHASEAVPLARHTSSAAHATAARARGLSALLASLPNLLTQHAVRELVVDLAELLHRRDVISARLVADPRRAPNEPPPHILVEVEAGVVERLARLKGHVGRAGVDVVIAAVSEPGFKEALGLVSIAEEDVASGGGGGGASQFGGGGVMLTTDDEEAHARVFRRRLDATKVQPARHAAGGLVSPDATAKGGRQLWNILSRADPEEPLSYYQKQQARYGRSRRGSTSIAGAWEQVYAGAVGGGSPASLAAAAAAAAASGAGTQRTAGGTGRAGSPGPRRASPSPARRRQFYY